MKQEADWADFNVKVDETIMFQRGTGIYLLGQLHPTCKYCSATAGHYQ